MEYPIRKEIHDYIFDLLFYRLPGEDNDLNSVECWIVADEIIDMIDEKYNIKEK